MREGGEANAFPPSFFTKILLAMEGAHAIMAVMQNSLSFAVLPLVVMAASAQVADISMEEAVARLVSYGLIRENADSERDDSIEILHHFAKLKNADEEINEFPYCVRLIQLGTPGNKVPVSCLRPFVAAGATVQGLKGDTSPLQAAAEVGDTKMMAYLLECGADLHYQDAAHLMALDYAVQGEEEAAAKFLLERGAIATPHGMEVAARGNREILQEMLHYGGIITAETLVAACAVPDNLELLLLSGGDINSRCRDGKTVAHAFLRRLSGDMPLGQSALAHTLDILEQFGADFYVPASERPGSPGVRLHGLAPDLAARVEKLYSQLEPKPLPPAEVEEAEEVGELVPEEAVGE